MASALAFTTGCDKNKGGGGGDDPDIPSGNGFVINAKVEDGNDYNDEIATVKAVMYNWDTEEEYSAASCKYANGGFKLTLPETVSAKYLHVIDEDFDDFEGTISDPQAKMGFVSIEAYDDDKEYIGSFVHGDFDKSIWVQYMYFDRDVTINGYDNEFDDEYNCSFKKGWNIMYITYTDSDYGWLYSTKKPSGANPKWYFEDDYDWKASPNNKAKHTRQTSDTYISHYEIKYIRAK